MTYISQKSKINPRRVLPSRAFSFRACVRASLLLFLCGSARLSAGAAKPLHTPPTLSPRRKDAATETKTHASTLAPSALCLVAKRAFPSFDRAKRSLFPAVRRSRSARPSSVRRLRSAPRQSLLRRFSFSRGALICHCRAFCAVSSLRAVSAVLRLCEAIRGRIARLPSLDSLCHPQTALKCRLRAAIIGGECLAPYNPRQAVFALSRPLDGLEIV